MEDNLINILLIIFIIIIIISLLVYIFTLIFKKHHYRFYLPKKYEHFKDDDKEKPYPSLYKLSPYNTNSDYSGCRMGTKAFITDTSKLTLPENKGFHYRPHCCSIFFSKEEREKLKKICPTLRLPPVSSNNRGNLFCCPTSLQDLWAFKKRTASLGGCGYNSTPAGLTYGLSGTYFRKAKSCAKGWIQATNPDKSLQYSSDTGSPCCKRDNDNQVTDKDIHMICGVNC
jgi:hypothetical protein